MAISALKDSSGNVIEAREESTLVIQTSFTNEDGEAETPLTLTWTLTDENGTVINSREDVEVSSPAASNDIVLSGDDLSMLAAEVTAGDITVERRFLVEATYNSDLGADLPLKDVVRFQIRNLVGVT